MTTERNVFYHTQQSETSHSPPDGGFGKFHAMNESAIFRTNLLRAMTDKGMSEAELSKKARLNARAVTDIREGRVASPKLSTVFRLAAALGIDPGELMGLGRRHRLYDQLAEFLEQFPEEDQARFLAALSALPRQPF
jgi:transcriptional regulator with XRE-family HTH domain